MTAFDPIPHIASLSAPNPRISIVAKQIHLTSHCWCILRQRPLLSYENWKHDGYSQYLELIAGEGAIGIIVGNRGEWRVPCIKEVSNTSTGTSSIAVGYPISGIKIEP
jgi:hypothetical protein